MRWPIPYGTWIPCLTSWNIRVQHKISLHQQSLLHLRWLCWSPSQPWSIPWFLSMSMKGDTYNVFCLSQPVFSSTYSGIVDAEYPKALPFEKVHRLTELKQKIYLYARNYFLCPFVSKHDELSELDKEKHKYRTSKKEDNLTRKNYLHYISKNIWIFFLKMKIIKWVRKYRQILIRKNRPRNFWMISRIK